MKIISSFIMIFCLIGILNMLTHSIYCQNREFSQKTLVHSRKLISTYDVEQEWIRAFNLDRYNNRPLYINNTNGFILAGDKPLVRLVKGDKLYGSLILKIKRRNTIKSIYNFDQIKSLYAPGHMKWELKDSQLKGINLILDVLPTANQIGMVVQLKIIDAKPNDELYWSFGGEKQYDKQNLSWKYDIMGDTTLLTWKDTNFDDKNALFKGTFQSKKNKTYTLSFVVSENKSIICESDSQAISRYAQALTKLDKIVNRMKINTPDPYLNAIAKASVFAVNATWYPPVFVHGAMLWNSPLPAWRTIFGGTVYGWHERVLQQAQYYIASQVKQSDKKKPKVAPESLMTLQHPDSRFFGVGRILKDQKRYNMQSQFFDQLIEDYRWTANPELEKVLRNALELHLKWIQDCFDPDGDGVYESYLNSWPTDSQWYNGGGTAEETSYAYRGHLAARDMARNAGDTKSEAYHNRMIQKIKKGFFDKLWIPNKGHSGSYREQGGHERLHENPWLYSIFLPIDANLTSQIQAIESVYYSEWALQNDTLPFGRQVWTSNWIPGIWSTRERWAGDNYHLALAYFQAGLPEDGWNIMKATYMNTAFNHYVPGNLGGQQGGTDFGDCVHMFSRTLVSGLFGFSPDYPNGQVKITPNFPKDWDYASIELPDLKISYYQKNNTSNYSFKLPQKTNMILKLPVQAKYIKKVTLNGKKTNWKIEPTAGASIVAINVYDSDKATISIEHTNTLPYYPPIFIEKNVGEEIVLTIKEGKIISYEDPQTILEKKIIKEGKLHAQLAYNQGYHTVIVQVLVGDLPQYRIFRVKINDPQKDATEAMRYIEKIPKDALWTNIDLTSYHNADIKSIYKQKYLSPRPNTVSVRLGIDGYSPWTFPIWKSTPPQIRTNNVKKMLKEDRLLITPQGVPFIWNINGINNIAFTSMWDNYPKQINFPINKKGTAIYFLISGSTNVMQCQIANAIIKLNYADGICDTLELIPPTNYWNLSPIYSNATAPGQSSRSDYDSNIDRFALPKKLPETVQLGDNCRAMLLNLRMRKGMELKSITLETLSQEVVVGLIGVTIMN